MYNPKSTNPFKAFAVFVAIIATLFLVGCSTPKHGYNYKKHHNKSNHAKPSKCFKKHNPDYKVK
jgi:hypothetical protein